MGRNTLSLSLLVLLLFVADWGNAQLGTTVSVQGNLVLGPCGDTLLLRGVNYAPYNWGWSPGQLSLDQIAQTGANCVRLPWYQTPASGTPTTTYGDLANLDSALSHCIQYQLIPILELHDLTCQNDTAALLALNQWYLEPGVLALIDKYKHSLILNIANEALYVNWTGNPAMAQATFVNTYSAAVQDLRNAGVTVPIMVDGPDCGTNLDVLAAVGNDLQQADPQHNLIFSAHAYWYAYAGNDSSQMATKIDNAVASGIPFIMGEVANLQDDQTLCQYQLNYSPLLQILQSRNIGWLAWSWDNDGCADRQLSTNGSFASLTAYGTDLVYHPDYGLYNVAPARSLYLFNGGNCSSVTGAATTMETTIRPFPNPSSTQFRLDLGRIVDRVTVEVYAMAGQLVESKHESGVSGLEIGQDLPAGIYLLRCHVEQEAPVSLRLVKR